MATKTTKNAPEKKVFSRYKEAMIPFPSLIETQLNSFDWLVREGLGEVFKEFSPISDYSGKKFELHFASFSLGEPKYNEHHAKENKLTYEAPLKARVKLVNKSLGGDKEQEIFLSDQSIDHWVFHWQGFLNPLVKHL